MTSTPTPSDPVAAVREALALGPTPGTWSLTIKDGPWVDAAYVRAPSWGVVARIGLSHSLPHWDGPQRANAAFIAACSPAAIAALVAQLEAAQRGNARYERVRRMTPRQFAELYALNIAGHGAFDQLVDVAALAEQQEGAKP